MPARPREKHEDILLTYVGPRDPTLMNSRDYPGPGWYVHFLSRGGQSGPYTTVDDARRWAEERAREFGWTFTLKVRGVVP